MHTKEVKNLPPGERPSIGDKDLDYAKEFWTVGNVITGFAIVQSLWFFTVIAPGCDAISREVNKWHKTAGIITLGVTLLYVLGVGFAHVAHHKIVERYSSSEDFRKYLMLFWVIRYGIVIVTGLTVSIALFYFELATSCSSHVP